MKTYDNSRPPGEVEYNGGDFAEIQTVGTERAYEDLLLETIEMSPSDAA